MQDEAVQFPEMEIFRCLRKEAIRSQRKFLGLREEAIVSCSAISISKDEEDITFRAGRESSRIVGP